MEKQDAIDIIKAWEKLEQLDMVIASITGGEGIDQVEYKDLFGIFNVIKRHTSPIIRAKNSLAALRLIIFEEFFPVSFLGWRTRII